MTEYIEDPERPTVYDNFKASVNLYPSRPCLATREYLPDGVRGEFQYISYEETSMWVDDIVHAIHSTGLCDCSMEYPDPIPHINVGLLGSNSASWVVTDLACQKLGLVTVPVYSSLRESEIVLIAKSAQLSAIAVNEANFQLAVDQVLPHVRPFTLSDGDVEVASRLLIFMVDNEDISDDIKAQLTALMHFGVRILVVQQPRIFDLNYSARQFCRRCNDLNEKFPVTDPKSVCTIIYTSGSTGVPKGAMLSHENIMSALFGFRTNVAPTKYETDPNFRGEESDKYQKLLSYLPLEHVLGRQLPWLNLLMGGSICFWSQNPKTLSDDIKACRPSYFIGVPRVFHRIINTVFSKVDSSSFIVRGLFRRGLRTKLQNYHRDGTFVAGFWDKIVFSKIAKALGGNTQSIVSGSAPLGGSTSALLKVLFSCPVVEGYGQTETAASLTSQKLSDNSTGSDVGSVLVPKNGIRFRKLDHIDDTGKEGSIGEILFKGPTVFMGYYQDPETTAKVFDDNGWLHTGDIGEMDKDGQLHILDRVGSIFKLANGLFVSPRRY
ncbi:hypothetical protein GEMRC1_007057 [Eukaryota sp. GEM-RC1]